MYAESCAVFFADGVAPERPSPAFGPPSTVPKNESYVGMFASNWTPEVQFGGSVCAIGACGIGHSPPTVSDCVLARYGQNMTESEFMTPAGQFASGAAAPFTGFSGIGGLNVPPGA